MTEIHHKESLDRYFRKQAIRWAILGLVLTLLCSIPCILFSTKIASERQIQSTARSTARVFREMILEEDIRDAEFQMRNALQLGPNESATIFDPEFNAIYPLKGINNKPHCTIAERICWGSDLRTLSILYPIYFNERLKEGVFGYLELTLVPFFDLTLPLILATLLLIAFTTQAFGLSSALSQSSKKIVDQLSLWATHLKTNPGEREETRYPVPFEELNSMQQAVDGLYFEIEKLREKAARDAKSEAHASILREIGHDLRTPHSLLAKYFALHIDTVRTTGKLEEAEVMRVEGTLKRMGDLLRQVRTLSFKKSNSVGSPEAPKEICVLNRETSSIVNDLRNDPDLLERNVLIEFHSADTPLEALISKTGYYRILENLIRNAGEAVSQGNGHITVKLALIQGQPAVSVIDNGSGIAPEIQDKIFDLDFTTKPSRGTGLGLGIVHKLCIEFGAKIHLEATSCLGTTFTVLFQSPVQKTLRKASLEVSRGEA